MVKLVSATPLTTATLLTVPKIPRLKLTVPPFGVPALPPPTLAIKAIVWEVGALALRLGAITLTVVLVGAGRPEEPPVRPLPKRGRIWLAISDGTVRSSNHSSIGLHDGS